MALQISFAELLFQFLQTLPKAMPEAQLLNSCDFFR